MFFRDVLTPLPPVYNLLVAMLWRHPELVELEKVKVVHYCVAGSKPWKYTGKEENMDREDMKMLVKKWCDIYNDETLDYRSGATITGCGVADGKNWVTPIPRQPLHWRRILFTEHFWF